MKYWEDDADIGLWQLYLGSDTKDKEEVAMIWRKKIRGEERYLFSGHIGNSYYADEPLEAKTIEEAKKELENLLIKKYGEVIESRRLSIKYYESRINELKES